MADHKCAHVPGVRHQSTVVLVSIGQRQGCDTVPSSRESASKSTTGCALNCDNAPPTRLRRCQRAASSGKLEEEATRGPPARRADSSAANLRWECAPLIPLQPLFFANNTACQQRERRACPSPARAPFAAFQRPGRAIAGRDWPRAPRRFGETREKQASARKKARVQRAARQAKGGKVANNGQKAQKLPNHARPFAPISAQFSPTGPKSGDSTHSANPEKRARAARSWLGSTQIAQQPLTAACTPTR